MLSESAFSQGDGVGRRGGSIARTSNAAGSTAAALTTRGNGDRRIRPVDGFIVSRQALRVGVLGVTVYNLNKMASFGAGSQNWEGRRLGPVLRDRVQSWGDLTGVLSYGHKRNFKF